MKIGILALQGDYSLHKNVLDKLDVESFYIRNTNELSKCDSLIIPGGESTTMSILIQTFELYDSIRDFSLDHTVFGTCAGAILMSKSSKDSRVSNLNCINISTKRNSWGSQVDSFKDKIELTNEFSVSNISTTFIRAPKFYDICNDCSIIGRYNNEPVLIRNDKHIVSSFHPEIDINMPIYEYYLKMIKER